MKKVSLLHFSVICIILFATFWILATLHSWLGLQSDDWCHAGQGTRSLSGMIHGSVIWGGRFFFNMLTFLVSHNVALWRVINPLMMIATICLIVLVSSKERFFSKQNIPQFLLAIALILSLDMLAVKEVFYWIAGSTNYLWTVVFMLTFFFIWTYSLSQKDKVAKKFYFLLPVLGIFTGLSQEQTGIIAIFLITAMLFWKFPVMSTSSRRFHIAVLILVVISYLILVLVPGNTSRTNWAFKFTSGESQYFAAGNYYEKISLRASQILFKFHSFQSIILTNLLLFITVTLSVFFGRKKNTNKKIMLVLLTMMSPYAFLLILKLGNMRGWWDIALKDMSIIILSYIIWILSNVAMLSYGVIFLKKEKDPKLLLFIVSALLSMAGMLLVSNTPPYRTFFITIVLSWCSLIYVVSRLENKIVKLVVNIAIFCFLIEAVFNYYGFIGQYRNNYIMNAENEKRISNFLKKHDSPNLVLLKLPKESAISNMPKFYQGGNDIEWLRACFKHHYGLDSMWTDVDIIWK